MDLVYLSVFSLESKNSRLCGRSQLRLNFYPLIKKPGRIFILTQGYLNMENVEGMEAQVLEYQKIEEVFEYKDCEVFDTILSVSSIDILKNKLKVLMRHRGTRIFRKALIHQ